MFIRECDPLYCFSTMFHCMLPFSASYIEQFWNTATSKTVNSVKQIHAIVNDRAIVISESSVRNDLLFDDEDGITCLTNDGIFENLALMGKGVKFSGKVTPLFDSMLVPHQAPEGEGSEQPIEPQPTPSPTHPTTGDQPPVQSSHDSPLLGDHTSEKAEGGLNLEELFVLCTTGQQGFLLWNS
ncbi:hypothetical protein Tco_0817254 [Tanacetum coccineum]